jgi:diketogulonate reductase-like aldo/keto reductase|tara:strand:+ start:2745 stop:3128 length:384 start_codon:yes stop_codon:yes gene_type:complete
VKSLTLSHALKAGLASAALFAVAPLAAQTTQPAPAAPASPAAPAAGASNFSDSDIQQFAAAATEVTKIQADASIPAAEKQPKMLAALQASGLPPEKFNQIGQAAATDPALQQRIQAAAPAAPAQPQP